MTFKLTKRPCRRRSLLATLGLLAATGFSNGCGGSKNEVAVANPPAAAPAAAAAEPAPAAAAPAEDTAAPATEQSGGDSATSGSDYESQMASSGSDSASEDSSASSSSENYDSTGEAMLDTTVDMSSYEEQMRSAYTSEESGSAGNSNGPAGAPAAQQPAGPPPLKFPQDYRGQAAFALSQGLDRQAHDLFLAHLAIEPESSAADYDQLMFFNLLRQPTWDVRWGMGLYVQTEDGYAGNSFPPTDDMKAPLNKDGGGGGGGSGESSSSESSSSEGSTASPAASAFMAAGDADAVRRLEQHLGVVATMVAEEFDSRYRSGAWGNIFPDLVASNEFVVAYLESNGSAKPAAISNSESSESMESSSTSESSSSSESMEMTSSAPAANPNQKKTPSRFQGLPNLSQQPDAPHVRPGLVFVQADRLDEMTLKAKEMGLHLLLECYSRVERNRQTGVVTNQIRVRLIDVTNGKPLVTSKKIDNVEIYKKTQQSKPSTARKEVEEAMENFWTYVDTNLKVIPMPSLTPEMARARVASLLTGSMEQRLSVLAEIRTYHAKGLLTDDDLVAALDILMGEDGLILLDGTLEQKQALLEPLVPRFVSAGF